MAITRKQLLISGGTTLFAASAFNVTARASLNQPSLFVVTGRAPIDPFSTAAIANGAIVRDGSGLAVVKMTALNSVQASVYSDFLSPSSFVVTMPGTIQPNTQYAIGGGFVINSTSVGTTFNWPSIGGNGSLVADPNQSGNSQIFEPQISSQWLNIDSGKFGGRCQAPQWSQITRCGPPSQFQPRGIVPRPLWSVANCVVSEAGLVGASILLVGAAWGTLTRGFAGGWVNRGTFLGGAIVLYSGAINSMDSNCHFKV